MAADRRTCPACGAALELATAEVPSIRCGFCGWTAAADDFPTADPDTQSRYNAETLPLPQEPAAELELDAEHEPEEPSARPEDGPAQFLELTKPSQAPVADEQLLEQVPEELRGVLAERMQAADQAAGRGFRPETVESLKARGYQVTEDARGARISGGSSRSPDLSPYEMVRMAAEQDGGVQPRAKLPICPECQAASPVGEKRCQWCGADLPHG